jgi:hypothetical protein
MLAQYLRVFSVTRLKRIVSLCALSEGRDGMRLRNVGIITVSSCNYAIMYKQSAMFQFISTLRTCPLSSLMANVW